MVRRVTIIHERTGAHIDRVAVSAREYKDMCLQEAQTLADLKSLSDRVFNGTPRHIVTEAEAIPIQSVVCLYCGKMCEVLHE